MFRRTVLIALIVALLLTVRAIHAGPAANGCAAFEWNVEPELTLMRAPAAVVAALAKAGDSSARVAVGKHYTVKLLPQSGVQFALPPARPARDPAPQGGSLVFRVETAGRYRISLTSRHWIDVVAGGRFVDSSGHQGRADCELMHKVVEFELPANTPLIIQLSGQPDREVGLAITRSPATG